MSPVWEVAPHPDATDREAPGNFREHDIRPFPGGMTPVSWPLGPAQMDTWIKAVNALDAESLTFPESLAEIHCRFEQVHPFLDGNGRTGRLLLNLILVRLGYPPAIIYKRDRSRYLGALQKADRGESGPLGEMLARAILDNLYRFVIPAVAGSGPPGAAQRLGDPGSGLPGAPCSSRTRPAPGDSQLERPLAQLSRLGGGIQGHSLPQGPGLAVRGRKPQCFPTRT